MQEQGGSKDIRTPPDYNRGVGPETHDPPVPAALLMYTVQCTAYSVLIHLKYVILNTYHSLSHKCDSEYNIYIYIMLSI